jgi:hypothetical protein
MLNLRRKHQRQLIIDMLWQLRNGIKAVVSSLNKVAKAVEHQHGVRIEAEANTPEARAQADAFDKATDAIQRRVSEAMHYREHYLTYCPPWDGNDVPIDNLDAIAVKGHVKFVQKAGDDGNWGAEGANYAGNIHVNPTWLQVCKDCEDMIRATGDLHHIFLEAIHPLPDKQQDEEGVQLYTFSMGS